MTVDAIVATRRIVSGLRPRALDEFGLAAALQQLGKDFAARTGVVCDVQVRETPSGAQEMTPVEADCLYRVAQEALQNVEKHAGAQHVQVRLTAEVPGQYELELVDDGVGLDLQALEKPTSLGLLGMEERTRELGGSLEVRNAAGGGTLVRARLSRPG
jgi:signal transduction histidine kinase